MICGWLYYLIGTESDERTIPQVFRKEGGNFQNLSMNSY